jgi:hypothetical protein
LTNSADVIETEEGIHVGGSGKPPDPVAGIVANVTARVSAAIAESFTSL